MNIMKQLSISRATLSRLPIYLQYIKKVQEKSQNISAASIAEALNLGDVLVRKDLASVCGSGRPKLGYVTSELIAAIEDFLGYNDTSYGIIVGAGKLGTALLNHDGFHRFGLEILGAFDKKLTNKTVINGKSLMPMDQLEAFCSEKDVHIGIITVPENAAQEVCDILVANNIKAIWNFARCNLKVPDSIAIKNEDLALSLAYLSKSLDTYDNTT